MHATGASISWHPPQPEAPQSKITDLISTTGRPATPITTNWRGRSAASARTWRRRVRRTRRNRACRLTRPRRKVRLTNRHLNSRSLGAWCVVEYMSDDWDARAGRGAVRRTSPRSSHAVLISRILVSRSMSKSGTPPEKIEVTLYCAAQPAAVAASGGRCATSKPWPKRSTASGAGSTRSCSRQCSRRRYTATERRPGPPSLAAGHGGGFDKNRFESGALKQPRFAGRHPSLE